MEAFKSFQGQTLNYSQMKSIKGGGNIYCNYGGDQRLMSPDECADLLACAIKCDNESPQCGGCAEMP